MELYKELPKGLYLGRTERTDQHIILLDTGELKNYQTVKVIDMSMIDRKVILELFDKSKPDITDRAIYDDNGIFPRITPTGLVANRAVGSRARFNKLSMAEKKKLLKNLVHRKVIFPHRQTN